MHYGNHCKGPELQAPCQKLYGVSDVFSLTQTVYLVGIVFCLLTALLVWRFTGIHNRHNMLLVAYFFTCCWGNFIVFLVYSGAMQEQPWYHLFRTGNITALMIMPVSYLYFRSVLKQKPLRPVDLVHFLPALLYAIDYYPVFLLPSVEKLSLAAREMAMPDRGQSIQRGWIRPTINWIIVRTLLIIIYWSIQVGMLYSIKKIRAAQKLLKENAAVLNWLKVMVGIQTLFFAPFLVNFLFGAHPYNFAIIHTSISLSVFIQMVFLIFRPELWYGLKGAIVPTVENPAEKPLAPVEHQPEPIVTVSGNETDPEPAGKSPQGKKFLEYLTAEKIAIISVEIEKTLAGQKAFLRPGYSLRDLSFDTGIQPHVLSIIINQVHQYSFSDLINMRRVEHACELIQAGDARNLTLEALAESCGFRNRNSFTSAFKKHTGQTPSSYLRALPDTIGD